MFPKEEDKNSDTLFLTCSFIHGIMSLNLIMKDKKVLPL